MATRKRTPTKERRLGNVPAAAPNKTSVSRQVRREVPQTSDLTDDSMWTAADVVALLADGMPRTQEERNRRDRARKRLRDHLRRGLIVEQVAGVFKALAVVAWAHKHWTSESARLPALPSIRTGSASAGGRGSAVARGLALPGSIAECHAKISAMDARIVALEQDLAAARQSVRELTPDAAWARKRKEGLRGARAKKK